MQTILYGDFQFNPRSNETVMQSSTVYNNPVQWSAVPYSPVQSCGPTYSPDPSTQVKSNPRK